MQDTFYNRILFDEVRAYFSDKEIIVLLGSRQVGKTTLLKMIQNFLDSENKETLFIDLEDNAFFEVCNKGAKELASYLTMKGIGTSGLLYLFIDEIQYLDNPSSFLKILHDHYGEKYKVFVSGSSTFRIKSKFKDSLVGRTLDFNLFPLNFSEFLEFNELKYNLALEGVPQSINMEMLQYYKSFLSSGGYPAIVLEKVKEKKEKKISEIVRKYLRADIIDIGNIKEVRKFNALLEILASQTGNILNVSELSRTIGLAKQTIDEYLFLLENTFIIKLVRPYYNNLRSELTKMPKIYFEDTGTANYLENKQLPEIISGKLFENSIFNELRKICNEEDIYYWRTSKGHEIDFIIKIKKELLPIEVKTTFSNSDLSGIRYFYENYRPKCIYICTMNKKMKCSEPYVKLVYPWELISIIKTKKI